ncbi:hypothetical protein ABK040_000178 [Willaertia magna]
MPEEKKIAEGVYMTDFRKPNQQPTNFTAQEEYENLLATTQYEVNDLTLKIFHLERSNKEMLEMDPKGEDIDLVEAIIENENVIFKYKKRLEIIKERLSKLQINCIVDVNTSNLVSQDNQIKMEDEEEIHDIFL